MSAATSTGALDTFERGVDRASLIEVVHPTFPVRIAVESLDFRGADLDRPAIQDRPWPAVSAMYVAGYLRWAGFWVELMRSDVAHTHRGNSRNYSFLQGRRSVHRARWCTSWSRRRGRRGSCLPLFGKQAKVEEEEDTFGSRSTSRSLTGRSRDDRRRRCPPRSLVRPRTKTPRRARPIRPRNPRRPRPREAVARGGPREPEAEAEVARGA